MRLLSLRLKGYCGIYNGIGRTEIVIDFSRSRHKICLIKGDTGSGKTTILNSMSPFPDANSCFLPNMDAEKELIYDNGIRILLQHPMGRGDSRGTTRGFIAENGLELNPNGNITSFKEIVSDKFGLDPNFEALTQLSTRDRGLADKTPAERKKYVSSIIQSLEVYNNMYKVLNKNSSVLKQLLNSIVAKIDAIGNAESLKSSISGLEGVIAQYEEQKERMIADKAAAKAIISTTDPDGSLMNSRDGLNISLKEATKTLSNIEVEIRRLYRLSFGNEVDITKIHTPEAITMIGDVHRLISDTIVSVQTKINDTQVKIAQLTTQNDYEVENLRKASIQQTAMINEENYDELCNNIQRLTDLLNKQKGSLEANGYEVNLQFTIPELEVAKRQYSVFLSDLQDLIAIGPLVYLKETYNDVCQNRSLLANIKQETAQLIEEREKLIEERATCQASISIYNSLSLRPSDCKNDTCPFIKDALALPYNPNEEIQKIDSKIDAVTKRISRNDGICASCAIIEQIQKAVSSFEVAIPTYCKINANFKECLATFNNDMARFIITVLLDPFSNYSSITDCINKCATLVPITHFDYLIENVSLINLIQKTQDELNEQLHKKELLDAKYGTAGDLTDSIIKMKDKLANIQKELTDSQVDLTKFRNSLESNTLKRSHIEEYETAIANHKQALNEIAIIQQKLADIDKSMADIDNAVATIKAVDDTIAELNNSLTTTRNEMSRLKFNLQQLNEYDQERKLYQERWDKTEIVKYYTSPTRGEGIQLVFMDMYMNNVLSMANSLLGKVFGGQFALQPFIINGDEFRIPCIGNRMMNDDISSMSTGQICMISMILSFSLLYNSATNYNILRLDEIDGGLDTENRGHFIKVLNDVMDMLGCQQCFLISHNEEIQYSSTDMILLKSNTESMNYGNANIIFDINRD